MGILSATSASMTTIITTAMMKPKDDVTQLLRQVVPFTEKAPSVSQRL
jgi:hypothetical protein